MKFAEKIYDKRKALALVEQDERDLENFINSIALRLLLAKNKSWLFSSDLLKLIQVYEVKLPL